MIKDESIENYEITYPEETEENINSNKTAQINKDSTNEENDLQDNSNGILNENSPIIVQVETIEINQANN